MDTPAFMELIQSSKETRKGITFFLPGQTIAGVVTKVEGTEVVEARSQTYSRIVIRLDQILAIAIG